MIYGLYSIKDLKTGYLPPTAEYNDSSAVRNFEHGCQRVDSLFYTHPGDYQFWKLGTYDTETGEIVYDPKFLCDAPLYKKEV